MSLLGQGQARSAVLADVQRFVATRTVNGVVDRLRPLCPYPQVAVYTAQGDTNDDASFVCQDGRGTHQPSPPR